MFHRYRRYFYRFNNKLKKMLLVKEKLEIELRDSIVSQITQSLALEEDKKISNEVRVHELRKSIKRSRALLRLLRPALKKKSFYTLDEIFGKAARMLADQREATVNLRTFITLTSGSKYSLPADLKEQILNRLTWQVDHMYNTSQQNFAAQLHASLLTLKKAKSQIETFPLKVMDESTLADYIKKTYYKAAKLYKDAHCSPDTEIIHKWRKFNKHLLHQLKFAPVEADSRTRNMIISLELLSDTLGNEHDLAVMEDYLIDNFNLSGADKNQVHLMVVKVRNRLQKDAFKLGAKLYA